MEDAVGEESRPIVVELVAVIRRVVTNYAAGRADPDDVTICKDRLDVAITDTEVREVCIRIRLGDRALGIRRTGWRDRWVAGLDSVSACADGSRFHGSARLLRAEIMRADTYHEDRNENAKLLHFQNLFTHCTSGATARRATPPFVPAQISLLAVMAIA